MDFWCPAHLLQEHVAVLACASMRFAPVALLLGLLACASAPESPEDWPPFSADTVPKMSEDAWRAVREEAKSRPGARVREGPELTRIDIETQNEQALYFFTRPSHPAHPAYIQTSPDPTNDELSVVVGYAGSKSEFETFVRAFLEVLRERK